MMPPASSMVESRAVNLPPGFGNLLLAPPHWHTNQPAMLPSPLIHWRSWQTRLRRRANQAAEDNKEQRCAQESPISHSLITAPGQHVMNAEKVMINDPLNEVEAAPANEHRAG